MIVVLYILIVLQVLSAIGAIALIGDERKPRTKNEAIISVIYASVMVVIYVLLIARLTNG